ETEQQAMKKNVNTEIAFTHLLTRKRQTLIASLGVTLGITVFIFLNSLVVGFNRFFDNLVFKSIPHVRIYKDDEISRSLITNESKNAVLLNPKILNEKKNIINPMQLASVLKTQQGVKKLAPWVTVNLFYTSGQSQISGFASGANIIEADSM